MMNEKTLENVTGLSRRQIIMLQKNVVERKNKVVIGIAYEYSDDEVEQFMLAKIFKDCGYTYPEIRKVMDDYKKEKIEVINKAILKIELGIKAQKSVLEKLMKLKEKEEKS